MKTPRPHLAATRISLGLLLVLLGVAAAAEPSRARPGDLDTSFGADGRLQAAFAVGQSSPGNALAVQPDGKIIVIGTSRALREGEPKPGPGFGVARYNADGSLDTEFDQDGLQTTDLVGEAGWGSYAEAVAVQTDGRIVVAGTACRETAVHAGCAGSVIALARYERDGQLDSSFSGDGVMMSSIGPSGARAVAIQPDGRIVVAGYTEGEKFVVLRYEADGSPDESFGTGGRTAVSFPCECGGANDLVLQGDGRILVAGYVSSSSFTNFALARLNPNGSLDTDFSEDGRQVTAFALPSTASALALQMDGRAVVVGSAYAHGKTDATFLLARYRTDGSLDPTFSGDGRQYTRFPIAPSSNRAVAQDVVLEPSGVIVVGGGAGRTLALVRYLPDGNLDGSFNSDGRQLTSLGTSDAYRFGAVVDSLALSPDGRIVATATDQGSGFKPTLLRHLGDSGVGEPFADLSVEAGYLPDVVRAGDDVTFSALVRNAGRDPATDVELVVQFSEAPRWRPRPGTSQGRCRTEPTQTQIRCKLGTLRPGNTANVTLPLVLARRGGKRQLVATAFATGLEADPDTVRNDDLLVRQVLRPLPGPTPPRVRIRRLAPRSGRICTRRQVRAEVTVTDVNRVFGIDVLIDGKPRSHPPLTQTGRLRVTIPASRLAPGAHRLRVVADTASGPQVAEKVIRVCRG